MEIKDIKLIPNEDLKRMNRVMRTKFGPKDSIVAGSYICDAYGNEKCHITLYDSNSHKSLETLRLIGQFIQNILGVEEVYHLGARIA